jgi:prolipoprotein diacylglyceryltransferase
MNHEVLHLGPIVIYTYGMWLALGFLAGAGLAVREAERHGIKAAVIYELATQLMIVALVFGRLGHILQDLGFYIAKPIEILNVAQGGLSYVTAFGACFLYTVHFAAKRKLLWRDLLDVLAPGLAVGLVIGSLGALDETTVAGALQLGSFYWPPGVIAFFTIEYAGLWRLVKLRRRLAPGCRFWLVVKTDAFARAVSSIWSWLLYGQAQPMLLSLLGVALLYGLAWQQTKGGWVGGWAVGVGRQLPRRRRPTRREQLTQLATWSGVYIVLLMILARSLPVAA